MFSRSCDISIAIIRAMTMPKYVPILVALLLCNPPNGIAGFAINGQRRRLTLNAASGEIAEAETGSSSGSKLELKGDVEVATSPLTSLPGDKLASFFESTEVRNLLVTAGGKRPCEELSVTADILGEWKQACDKVGAQEPDESDTVLSVRTGGIDFPGLHLVSKAKIGTKLIQEPTPRYEFVLIGDEQIVTGLPPVVWIYNKLTGANGEKSSNASSSSLSVISYDETSDGKAIFTSKASLSVVVNFPTILLKLLPTNKEKAEETGGKALCNTVEKDVQASIDALEKSYMKCFD